MPATVQTLDEGRYALAGTLTVDTVPALWPQIEATVVHGREIRVSCAGVTHADSAAVACLVEWARLARVQGGGLRAEDLPEVMRVIVEVSDLEEIFP
ncbi:STAS domain-containing protein [Acidihalobacter ferrooxydans]|uniref:MlaB-like STAS domain-containing protein n=1 Tax=Acidihalobacter ferrooxydans TaxID=1765967 RepID=A0A1P8UF62_9GAMM|nr:STAS domain-containing protein [Acidihalobacter ferrooxydans]APZ42458.1 hypothetical protein BW247_04610 [Acidihalobacter ferrooxydans]